jgi:hypothetical protein
LTKKEIKLQIPTDFYTQFFNRSHPNYSWTPIIDTKRSLLNEFNIAYPNDIELYEKRYSEYYLDEDDVEHHSEIWEIGN